jgi:hypothetical protein
MDKPNSLAAVVADRNSGLVSRQTFATESHEIDMIGRIHTYICFQDRCMLNEVNTKIKLIRSQDAFCLMTTGAQQFKVVVTEASLLVSKVKISPSVCLTHAKTLENGTAKYPIRRVICKSFTIPAGYLDVSHEKLFLGQLTTRLTVGLVDNRVHNGDRERNLFNFRHFSLTEIGIYLDGQLYVLKPLKLDFAAGRYLAAYAGLFGDTNKINRDENNGISRTDFYNGDALYTYDLIPNLGEDAFT